MANRYGEAALLAVQMQDPRGVLTPGELWQRAISSLYPTSPSAQRKSGPKGAFLGLCEAGLVRDVPSGQYNAHAANKAYAVAAVEYLRAGTHKTVSQLWPAVTGDAAAGHDSQMDVVLALWKNGHIVSGEV